MNETTLPKPSADVPWPTSDERARVPDTSMLPGAERCPPATEAALSAKADSLREARDARVEALRTTVRDNPLVAVATALALGAVIARVARITR